jgi:hypothetical protein
MADVEEISDQEKVRIVSDFILHAPPGKYLVKIYEIWLWHSFDLLENPPYLTTRWIINI